MSACQVSQSTCPNKESSIRVSEVGCGTDHCALFSTMRILSKNAMKAPTPFAPSSITIYLQIAEGMSRTHVSSATFTHKKLTHIAPESPSGAIASATLAIWALKPGHSSLSNPFLNSILSTKDAKFACFDISNFI